MVSVDVDALHEALLGFGWSLFTELGVPGVLRSHRQVVLDPEPIVVAIPALFEIDPRLRDQVYSWCATHSDRLSISRINGLSRRLSSHNRVAFHGFAATLREHSGVKWSDKGQPPWNCVPEVNARRLPMERPALLCFRIRTLCGVGARADVLNEMIWRSSTWTRASDLSGLGYSKRTVAGILSDLHESGIARQLSVGNALTFQLAHRDDLVSVLDAGDLAFLNWERVMSLVLMFLELSHLGHKNPMARRVEANKRRGPLRALSDELGLETPPITSGNSSAWGDLMSWAIHCARDLSCGASSFLQIK